jgi:hypothetical protein
MRRSALAAVLPEVCHNLSRELGADEEDIAWAWDAKVPELELKGWGIVIEPDAQGVLTKFRFDEAGPHQTLVRKKN